MKFILLIILLNTSYADEYRENDQQAVQKVMRFSDRFFIKNTLLEIFGKEIEDIIDLNYFKTGKQVGGSCDIYEQVFYTDSKLADKNKECVNGKTGVTFPLYPENSLLRSANILKTCYLIIHNRPLSKSLKKKLFSKNKESSIAINAYREFYPYGGNSELLNLLKNKKKGFFEGTEEFSKKILFDLCLSPTWQIL
jgi:hypothetical protein